MYSVTSKVMYVRNHTFVRFKSAHLRCVCSRWSTASDCALEHLQGAHLQIAAVIYGNGIMKLLEPFRASCFFVGLFRSNIVLNTSQRLD